jgi:hypothetical protein
VWGCDPGQGITRTQLFGRQIKPRSSNFLIIVDVGLGEGRRRKYCFGGKFMHKLTWIELTMGI